MSGLLRLTVIVALTGLWQSGPVRGDWPHWRGPDRNDRSPEHSGWDGQRWLEGPIWDAQVGEGSSSPIVVGDRVYLTGWSDDQDTLVCLDYATGKELWHRSYDCPRYGRFAVGDQRLYSGACSTPEYDPASGLLFTLSVDGDLHAWNTRQDGARVWTLNLYDRYGAKRRPEVARRRKTRRDYGYMSSPIVLGEQLIVEVGGPSGTLVSFDKQTGRERWKSACRDEAGHTGGPVPMTVDGVPCVVVLTLRNLVVCCIEGADAGATVATLPWTTDFANNIATPVVVEDSVLVTSAYNQNAMCRVKIEPGQATPVWRNALPSGVCTPLVHDGHIYWAWRKVHCVDFETGKEVWAGGRVGSQGSCILTKDDRLIVYANKGDLSLVETVRRSPDGFTQLATRTVFSRTDAWPHVVISDGRIICRDRSGRVQCLAVAAD